MNAARGALGRRFGVVAVTLAAIAVTACSHSTVTTPRTEGSSHGETSRRPVAAGGGSATLEVAGHPIHLTVQRCIDSGGSAVNITAVAPNTHNTLTVNVTNPIGASTLVYTTVRPDNSFTNYSLASTVTKTKIAGGIRGTSVKLSGGGLAQAYDAHGKVTGGASSQQLSLDAACSTIQPMQSPAQPAASGAVGPDHSRSATGTK